MGERRKKVWQLPFLVAPLRAAVATCLRGQWWWLEGWPRETLDGGGGRPPSHHGDDKKEDCSFPSRLDLNYHDLIMTRAFSSTS